MTGEATADIIARVYGKKPSELTANEKENISTLSQIAGGLAGALTAKANGANQQNGGGMALAVAGAETAKRAVENNQFFIGSTDPGYIRSLQVKAKADEIVKPIEEKATQYAIDQGVPHYIAIEGNIYKIGIKLSINTRNGTVYFTPSLSPIINPLESSYKVGFSTEVGWIYDIDPRIEGGKNLARTIDSTLEGGSFGAKGCVFVCAGVSRTISDKPRYLYSLGAGGGFSVGGDYSIPLNK